MRHLEWQWSRFHVKRTKAEVRRNSTCWWSVTCRSEVRSFGTYYVPRHIYIYTHCMLAHWYMHVWIHHEIYCTSTDQWTKGHEQWLNMTRPSGNIERCPKFKLKWVFPHIEFRTFIFLPSPVLERLICFISFHEIWINAWNDSEAVKPLSCQANENKSKKTSICRKSRLRGHIASFHVANPNRRPQKTLVM